MRNQVDYFEKVLRILKDLKEEHPDLEMSKHYSLATDCVNFSMTDKELYYAFKKYQDELAMNTLSDRDLEKVITDTDELFKEVNSDDIDDFESWEDNEFDQD